MRIVGIGIGFLVLLGGVAGMWFYSDLASIEVVPVSGDVSMLTGLGGNVGVLRTSAGPVVVDSMTFRTQGQRIRERAEELGGGPVQALINTHYHLDHTHGNPGFLPGTKVVSTLRTLEHLKHFDGGSWEGEAAALAPTETFRAEHELRIGGKTIRSLHPGRGHTDGDLVVLFVEDRVIHMGDLCFNGRYPNIDLEAGGSVREWSASLDRVLAMEDSFDHVIPGHGPLTDAAGIRRFQSFVRELHSVGEQAAAAGWSLEETLEKAPLQADAGYETIGVPMIFRLDRPFVIKRSWEEATGAVSPQNPPLPAAR